MGKRPNGTNAGTLEGVELRIFDGRATAALAQFSVAVSEFKTGAATLDRSPVVLNGRIDLDIRAA